MGLSLKSHLLSGRPFFCFGLQRYAHFVTCTTPQPEKPYDLMFFNILT